MEATVYSVAGQALIFANVLAGQLATSRFTLFINDVDPGQSALLTDFTVATFTGSAPKVITAWGAPFIGPTGRLEAVADQMQWDWTAGATETVYGVVIEGSTTFPFLGYSRLTTPKVMGTALDSIVFTPAVRFPIDWGTMISVE